MEKITFENMPSAIAEINVLLKTVISLLKANSQPEPDCWLNIDELISYLPQKPAKPTIYAWVAARSIPFHKRGIGSKRLYFLKSEIDEFLLNGPSRKSPDQPAAIQVKRRITKVSSKAKENGKS